MPLSQRSTLTQFLIEERRRYPGASGDFNGSKSAQEVAKAARYRLVIEEGPQNGSFIYKTMDRVTGEVIRQFPREQVVKMMQSERYDAGAVIDTTA